MKKVCLVVAAFAAAGAIPALADVRMAVQLDTQPVLTPPALVFPDNTPIAISLADLLAFTGPPSGPFRLTVWVFDDGMFQGQQSVPTTRLPALTITASPADTLPEQLDILAVGPSIVGTAVTFPAMPLTFDEVLTGVVGLAFLGSVQVQSPGGDSDEFRSRVRIAGRVLGNIGRDPATSGGIRDEIHVGQVWRLEARTNSNVEPAWATGNIRANIRTSGRWVDPQPQPGDLNSIGVGVLSASYGIDGDIRTGSRPRRSGPNGFQYPNPPDLQAFNPGHVGRIAVERFVPGSSLGLVGSEITAGDVTIQLIDGVPVNARLPGSIGEIYSAGAFGTAQRPITLDAGDTIHYVRAVRRNEDTDLLELGNQSIYAAVRTGTAILAYPFSRPPDPSSGAIAGALQRLETGGDFVGSLALGNMTALSRNFFGFSDVNSADLLVRHDHSAEFLPLAHAGILVRGSVVGSLTVRGLVEYADIIASSFTQPITVGHTLKGSVIAYGDPAVTPGAGHLPGLSVGLEPLLDNPEINARQPGFVGVIREPTEMDLVNDTPEAVWFRPRRLDSGSMDGLVRAATAGPLSFSAVSNVHFTLAGPGKNRPRIEVVSGESLSIGVLHAGLVWSGRLEYQPGTRVLANDATNDFASFGSISIGCFGAASDLWFTGTPHVSIANDLRGQIRTDRLQAHQLITIGGTLASQNVIISEPGISCASQDSIRDLLPEDSPRGLSEVVDDAETVAPFGAIYIRDRLGLAGQITLEANNTTANHDTSRLAGFVRVGGYLPPEPPAPPDAVLTFAASGSSALGVLPETVLPLYQTRSAALGGGAIGVVPFAVHVVDSPAISASPTTPAPFFSTAALSDPNIGLPLNYYGPVVTTSGDPVGEILARGIGTTVPFFAPACPSAFTATASGRTVTLVGVGSFCALEYQLVTAPLTIRSVVNLGTGPLTRDTLTPQPVYFRVGCTVGGNPNPADIVSIGGDPVPDGLVTGDDFNAFIAAFGAQDLLADITGVGGPPALPDGLLTGDDFIAFINAFAQGCDD